MLQSLMSDDHPLTLALLFERAATQFPGNELVSRFPDGSIHRYTYADFARRTRKLANALASLGIEPGDRVATLCWNEHRHLELYFAVPLSGAVVHTLNARLHPDELTYIVTDAADRALFVHSSLLDAFEEIRDRVSVEHVIVIPDDGPDARGLPRLRGADRGRTGGVRTAAAGRAAGLRDVSHLGHHGPPEGRALRPPLDDAARADELHDGQHRHARARLHAAGGADVPRERLGLPLRRDLRGGEAGLPRPATLAPSPCSRLFADEGVTLTGGVPTVFLDVLRTLDERPGEWDLSAMRSMVIGGSAAPPSLIEGFDRHGLHVTHAWGMTEMNPLGSIANLKRAHDGLDVAETLAARARQGHAQPLIAFRHVAEDGTVQRWDGVRPSASCRCAARRSRAPTTASIAPTTSSATAGSAPATS